MKQYLDIDFKAIVGNKASVFDENNFKLHVEVVHGNYLVEVEKVAQVSLPKNKIICGETLN